jgi:hypothetical protein
MNHCWDGIEASKKMAKREEGGNRFILFVGWKPKNSLGPPPSPNVGFHSKGGDKMNWMKMNGWMGNWPQKMMRKGGRGEGE